jgi:hypothetical protein
MTRAAVCGVPWPVCPDCLGEPLTRTAAVAWCARCRRRWDDGERMPCPDVATVKVCDPYGGGGHMCRSHAVRALAMIIDSTAEGLDATARAVSSSLKTRDAETAAMRVRDEARERAELAGELAPLEAARRSEIDAFNRGEHPVWRAYGVTPAQAAAAVEHARRRDDDKKK